MTDATFTAEHRSWQWELVLQYEDGSLPATEWNEATLAVVAGWYAQNLTPDKATARYQQYYHRNRRRLENRLGGAPVASRSLAAMDVVWESLLARVLPTGDPAPVADGDADRIASERTKPQ